MGDGDRWIRATSDYVRSLAQLFTGGFAGRKDGGLPFQQKRQLEHLAHGLGRIDARPLTTATRDSNWPQFTPDGKWVLYHHTGADALWDLWKVSTSGGTPVQLTSKLSTHPAVSPRDGRIACWYSEDAANPKWTIAILPPEGGVPEKRFAMPHTATPDTTLRWTPDGTGVTYVDYRGGSANLWVQPISGAPPFAITNFNGGMIYSFEWSRTGKLAYSRGTRTTDVVLIRDVRE